MRRPVRWNRPTKLSGAAVALGTVFALAAGGGAAAAHAVQSAPSTAVSPAADGGAQLSETTNLSNRRFVVTGSRAYEVGAEDATYPATGWHITGEMGGFWSMPIKLLDGLWFAANGQWLKATRFTSGEGYVKMDLAGPGGTTITRTDVVPDGTRATLVGLTFPTAQRINLTVDAHSELLSAYPWGWTTPSQAQFNLPDSGAFDGQNLVFTDQGTPPVAGAPYHDYAALVGSTLTPNGHALGPDYRGPQDPAVICPSSGPNPPRCDDGPYGRGTGGQLTYTVDVPPGGRTVWFAVAGSDKGTSDAKAQLAGALAAPAAAAAAKIGSRRQVAARTQVSLPGDPLLAQSVEWSKQNLADSVQESQDLRIFTSSQGTAYPPPAGTLADAKWMGAGWPDYPWIFATDGEYSAFAAVAAGQFTAIEDHLRTLMQVSVIANNDSGKVVHEITPDGQVYYGANSDPGNTDETVKFPSAVALVWRWTGDNAFRDQMYDFTVKNMKYALALDADGDGWPDGSGNVERAGMGQEKLDVTVYTIRGLLDLADMARSKGDTTTASWATSQAQMRLAKFEKAWWYPSGGANGYADSLSDPGDVQLFQRYWIGVTPMEAMLPGVGGAPARPVATTAHGITALNQRELDCYTGELGMYHTGTGPTSDPAGNLGPSCDSVVSAVGSERDIFSLNTAVMAVAEGNFGRLAQQEHYTTGNARSQLDPSIWEMPGAMPEIVPSPDGFGTNMGHDFLSRSSVLQTWGAYGILWPVVAQELGVSPDLGNGRLAVVPQIPAGQNRIAGSNIQVGSGSVDVTAISSGSTLTVSVTTALTCQLTIGTVLPAGAGVASVLLDGQPVAYVLRHTSRGDQVLVSASSGSHTLTVNLK